MTAILRRIDLATQILSPIATGFIISFIGVEYGALFIGGWNVLSVFAEYYLLWKVYNTVPSLRKVKDLRKSEGRTFLVDLLFQCFFFLPCIISEGEGMGGGEGEG